MIIREADLLDGPGMSDVLNELIAAGKRDNDGDERFVISHYLEHPHRLHCFVAVDDDERILGFQSLKRAYLQNPYDTPDGWGIIGTHVRPSAARKGVGSRLFRLTLAGSKIAALPAIEAYISESNDAAIAYYDAMGFRTHRCPPGIICKALWLEFTLGGADETQTVTSLLDRESTADG